MDNELNSDQNSQGTSPQPDNGAQEGICKKNCEGGCACPADEGTPIAEKPQRTTPPKISWI